MPFKKTTLICASVLMLLSLGSTSVSASQVNRPHRGTGISRHLNNVKRANHVKAIHARNLHRINRIKRHLINHQKNLIKISRRINRLKRHHHNADLIKRLNNDKARLISMIQHNERGMLSLAKTVANEEHQISLVRHPRAQRMMTTPITKVQLPKVSPNESSGVERSVTTVINEVNGKLTKYVAKDSSAKQNGNQSTYHQYSDVDGHYSAAPEQITQSEINRLNQQIQNQIQNSDQWFNEMNQEINNVF